MLSLMDKILCFFAISAMPARSVISIVGFAGVSTYMILVFGRIAFSTALKSVVSTEVTSTPNRTRVDLSKWCVPEYKVFEQRIWSPAFARDRRVPAIAPIPEPKATASVPCSNAAILRSTTVVFGFDVREYTKCS